MISTVIGPRRNIPEISPHHSKKLQLTSVDELHNSWFQQGVLGNYGEMTELPTVGIVHSAPQNSCAKPVNIYIYISHLNLTVINADILCRLDESLTANTPAVLPCRDKMTSPIMALVQCASPLRNYRRHDSGRPDICVDVTWCLWLPLVVLAAAGCGSDPAFRWRWNDPCPVLAPVNGRSVTVCVVWLWKWNLIERKRENDGFSSVLPTSIWPPPVYRLIFKSKTVNLWRQN